jgi:DNA-directed RNA polymerase subunit RPC12/RpoP
VTGAVLDFREAGMANVVECEDCGARLRVDAAARGKAIRCPDCGNRVEVEPPRRRPRDADDRPRRSRRREVERPSRLPWVVGGVAGLLGLAAVVAVVVWATRGTKPEDEPTVVKLKDDAGNQVAVRIAPKAVDTTQDRHVARRAKLGVLSLEVREVYLNGWRPHLALLHVQPIPLEQGKRPDPREQRFELWDVKAGTRVSTTPFGPQGLTTAEVQDLAPDGTTVLVSEPFQAQKVSTFSLAANRYGVTGLDLSYARKAGLGPSREAARWVRFADDRRLLVLYNDGAADLVDPAKQETVKLTAAVTNARGDVVDGRLAPRAMSGSRRLLQNYGLSADGRLFARWVGGAFQVADTRAGTVRHALAVTGNPKDGHEPQGVAFDPDGKFMVALLRVEYRRPGERHRDEMVFCRWDLTTGDLARQAALAIPEFSGGHHSLGWWGPRHLFVSRGDRGYVLEADTGKYLGACEPHGSGARLLGLSSDGKLHYLAEAAAFNKAHLLAVDPPLADFRPDGPPVKLTVNGPVPH